MAIKNVYRAPILDWRDVPRERMGEGMLTGARVARDLMALAKRSPQQAEKKIETALQQAFLDWLGEDTQIDDDMAGRKWAARALISGLVHHLAAASQHVDFEARFDERAAYAVELIKRLEPTNKTNPKPDQRARRMAKQLIHRAMRAQL
jgi:hypothetical protein